MSVGTLPEIRVTANLWSTVKPLRGCACCNNTYRADLAFSPSTAINTESGAIHALAGEILRMSNTCRKAEQQGHTGEFTRR